MTSYLTGKPAGGVYNPINLNLYHYAGNNPVKYVDLDGNQAVESYLLYLSVNAGYASTAGTVGMAKANSNAQLYDSMARDISNAATNFNNKLEKASNSIAAACAIMFISDLPISDSVKGKLLGKVIGTVVQSSDEVKVIGDDAKELPNQGSVSGGVEDAPPVDAGDQGKHVIGHNNEIEEKSKWLDGENGVRPTQEAFGNSELVKPDGSVRVVTYNDGRKVKIHQDQKGRIHGYPLN